MTDSNPIPTEQPKETATRTDKRRRHAEPDQQKAWREALREPVRFPRWMGEKLGAWIAKCGGPKVFLKTDDKHTDVILRFAGAPNNLPEEVRPIYSHSRVKLEEAFDEVLWGALAPGQDTLRSQLVTLGCTAYQESWRQVLWVNLGDQLDPAFNEVYVKLIRNWCAWPKRTRGPRAKGNEEKKQLKRRFKLLLAQCDNLHRRVTEVVEEEKARNGAGVEMLARVRRCLWEDVRQMRGGQYILGGEAFDKIPSSNRKRNPELGDPTTWKAKQLAISLLAFERHQQYETIERKLHLGGRRPETR